MDGSDIVFQEKKIAYIFLQLVYFFKQKMQLYQLLVAKLK